MLSPSPPHSALPHHPNHHPLQDTNSPSNAPQVPENMTMTHQPVIIVRAEEALIVIMVLVLWVAAIALFFNRWGKIRMLEPYQPKFIQQHRPSCPLVDVQQQHSFSKFNLNADLLLNQPHILRPRQNSVFVGSSMVTLPLNPPRKVKSAFDLQNLVLSDPALNRSIIRLNLGRNEIRRSSMLPAFEKAECYETVNIPTVLEKAQCYSETRRPDSRNNSISSTTRRGSILPESYRNVLSVDCQEKAFLPPPIKSGVLDFRRNSMLIINNLNEDVSPTPFHRNFSLGGSNINLVPDITPAIRRNSVIPPYALPKHKPKSLSVANSTEKYITNQKASKSLDSEGISKKPPPAVSELRRQFLQPITQKYSSSSSEALTVEFPKIIETRCSSPNQICDGNERFIFEEKSEERCSSQINLLASDEVYYGSSAPDLNCSRSIATTSSLTDLNGRRRSGVQVITTEADVSPLLYKMTNV